MSTQRVAVLRGGPSDEYEVSLKTGAAVLTNLPGGYTARDIIVTRGGKWLVDGFEYLPGPALEGVDVVFIALHGAYGEDGTIQRLLERLQIPYTGSGPYQSNVALNKSVTKEFLKKQGVKTPRYLRVTSETKDLSRIVHTISELFGPQYVVKPVTSGSSLGVEMVDGTTDLVQLLKDVLRERSEVLVEERIVGREATVGVVERFRDQKYYTLPAIEIVPPVESPFFTYESKYNGMSDEICPGRFDRATKRSLESIAAQVHQVMELSQYSRSDFMITEGKVGQLPEVYFLEVNTLPGLTEGSLFPKALSAVGHTYEDFISFLLTDAMAGKR